MHDKVRETADLSAKAPWRADSGGSSQDHNLAGAQQGKRVPTQVESLLASLESAKAGGAEAAVLACIEGALAAAKEARDKARPPKQQMADAEERVKKRKRAQETSHAAHNEACEKLEKAKEEVARTLGARTAAAAAAEAAEQELTKLVEEQVPVTIEPVAQGAQNQVIPEVLAYLVGQLQGAGLQAEAEGLEGKMAEIIRDSAAAKLSLFKAVAEAAVVAAQVESEGKEDVDMPAQGFMAFDDLGTERQQAFARKWEAEGDEEGEGKAKAHEIWESMRALAGEEAAAKRQRK